ncbi:hypothetical protein PTKIN_Ptkin09bG0051900 [Pterospermum kingtungense]
MALVATMIILEEKRNWTMETDENGQTPLHYAAHLGWHPVVRDMLKWNISAAYVADKKLEMTPLLMAARQGHVRTIREIVFSCPDCCEMVDKKGWNLFHYMALRDRRPEILFSDIISVRDLRDQKDARGITPRQVFDAFLDGLTIEKQASLKQTKIMEQIATMFEDITKEEVAEVPVRWFQHYGGYSFGGTLEKIKDSHLVVATLIATVTFAATVTVPGGYKSDNSNSDGGTPFLIRRAAFIAFTISNALAFMFSLAAVAVHFVAALPFRRTPKNHSFAMASGYIENSLFWVTIAFSRASFAVLQPSLWLAVVSCCIGLTACFHFYIGVYKILLGKVAVKVELRKRGISQVTDEVCVFCWSDCEIVLHLFFHCNVSRKVWEAWLFRWRISWCFPSDPVTFMLSWNSATLHCDSSLIWRMGFFAIIWTLWLHRNEILFNASSLRVDEIIDLSILRTALWSEVKWPSMSVGISEFIRNPELAVVYQRNRSIQCPASWIRPEIGCLKFNVDSSLLGKLGPAGIGGLLRDHEGRVKIRFSKTIGMADSNLAEILVIKEAFVLFAESQWARSHKLIVESDSSNAVSWSNHSTNAPWAMRQYINQIECLKGNIRGWEVAHVRRACN